MSYDARHRESVVEAADGRPLEVSTFEPEAEVRGVVLIVGAMATPASFYRPLAHWLAERGHRVVTFDYRATGSAEEMRAEHVDVDTWAADVDAVLAATAQEAGDLPLVWLGHSLGGQLAALVDASRVDRFVLVASGLGTWWEAPWSLRWKAPLLWYLVGPVATRVAGYFPGSRLGVLGDIPAGAMRQWSRWCRHSGYLAVDHPDAGARYAAITVPLGALSFEDDELMSATQIDRLLDQFGSKDQVRQRFSPSDLGRKVGHHGFFRRAQADLWDDLLLPLIADGAAKSASAATNAAVLQTPHTTR